jgi:hypothetical protein
VALELTPDPGDRGEPDVRLGRVGGAEAGAERRVVRDGMQVLGQGAMVCPACGLPTAPGGRIPVGRTLRCGFCDRAAPARNFVRRDVLDTLANEVLVVARLP